MSDKRNNAVGPQVHGPAKSSPKFALFVLFVLSLVGGLWASTQYFASMFHYHTLLGKNWHHLYSPIAFIRWGMSWQHFYPKEFMKAATIGTAATAAGLAMTALIKMAGSKRGVNPFLHGSARWADRKDIAAAGLLDNDDGVYVGAWADKNGKTHYLRHSGPEHVLTYAPTRSGKGVGLVIPTLLSWSESAVIADLKGELWELTAGWRHNHAGNLVIRFEPAAVAGSAHWNPMDEIRMTPEHQVGDVQNLATLIVDPDGRGLETHWQKTAQALLIGVILHALLIAKRGEPATLAGVERMLSDPDKPVLNLWAEMRESKNPVVSSAAQDMIDRPDEEGGSVLSTAKSYLSLYRDPVVAKNTSNSDFRIREIMNSEKPVSLYIITQPNDKSRLRPLVRVMMNMIVRLNADRMTFEDGRPKASYKHRMLAMIDEFPSLGKLSILQESLAFLAGYGIKFYLICQDINQLKSREEGYGPDETITSNCHIQNAFPPNRIETAEHLSKLTGQTTVIKEQVTTTGGSGLFAGPKSRTMQEVQRPLLTPDECLRMPGPKKDREGMISEAGDMVIYVAGYPAIYGRQPLFFTDPVFTKRSKVKAPDKSDRIGEPVPAPVATRGKPVAAAVAP